MRACERSSLSVLGVLELCWGQDWSTPVGLDGRRQEKAVVELVGRVQPPASSGACRLAGLFPALLSLSLELPRRTPRHTAPGDTHSPRDYLKEVLGWESAVI